MDDKRLLDGITALEGVILPAVPPPAREEGLRSGSAEPSDFSNRTSDQKPSISGNHSSICLQNEGVAVTVSSHLAVCASHLSGVAQGSGPALAFFLQLPTASQQTLNATIIPQQPHQSHVCQVRPQLPSSAAAELTGGSAGLRDRHVLRLSTEKPPEPSNASSPGDQNALWDPSGLRKAVLLLTFNSPAATHAALARLHAVALASQGRAALAALEPVPLVARVFTNAVTTGDHVGSERAATVLLALLTTAQLPLPEDVASALVIPAAIRLLGGSAAADAAAAATISAAAMAADTGGTLSCTALHVRLQTYPTVAAAPSLPSKTPYSVAATVMAPAAPISCRLTAARLLLHLATSSPSLGADSAATATAKVQVSGAGHPRPTPMRNQAHGAGAGAFCDHLNSAGALEACCEALKASMGLIDAAGAAELQCYTLKLLAALTKDATGWPWQWPVVRAATVDGCAQHAVALMQLLDGSAISSGGWVHDGFGFGGDGSDGAGGGSSCDDAKVEAHAAARSVMVHLSRGPLLVREALVRAGALLPVVEAVMMWPPLLPQHQGAALRAGPDAGQGQRLHFSICLGVLLNLSSVPYVRAALSSAALSPFLGHLLGLLEQQPWEAKPGGGDGPQPGEIAAVESAASQGSVDVRSALLELLLNLALDPQCHEGLAAQKVEAILVRCIYGGQQVKLDRPGPRSTLPESEVEDRNPRHLSPSSSSSSSSSSSPQQQHKHWQQLHHQRSYQQSWRAAAALRLVAALAADPRFSVPRPAMQLGLASVGALEVVAHEVQFAVAALAAPGAATAYDLAVTALCALMTGNGELQRQVAGMPELLMALSAALPHPTVARSDARLRITLAAWRLITSPLAAPGTDPSTARSLLSGLGHNVDMLLRTPRGRGGSGDVVPTAAAPPLLLHSKSRTLYDLTVRPSSRQHRKSILLTAAEMRTRLSSSNGESFLGGIRMSLERRRSSEHERTGEAAEVSERPRGAVPPPGTTVDHSLAAGAPRSQSMSSRKNGLEGVSGGDGGASGSATAPLPQWTGPLLPGTPLPPPDTPPPDVEPLRLPSCVLTVSESRPSSATGKAGAGAVPGEPSKSMSRSRSSRPSSRASTEPSQVIKPRDPPHRAIFISADSDEDDGCRVPSSPPAPEVLGAGAARRSGSHRLAATPPVVAASVQTASPPLVNHPPLPPLPGALTSVTLEETEAITIGKGEGVGSSSSMQRRSSGDSVSGAGPFAGATTEAIQAVSTSELVKGDTEEVPRGTSNSLAGGSRSAAADSAATAAAGLLAAAGQAPKAMVVNPALEMAPPLLCLVTNLQALFARPACRAVAALVLVQLARLEVVRSSAVMATGWGALMEAVTSSLTGVTDRSVSESDDQIEPFPGHLTAVAAASSSSSSGSVLTDPRDQLALLEVMDVAAGSPGEGRAALTSRSVLSVLCDLSCGQGNLAASLAGREGLVPRSGPAFPPHSHARPFRHHHHQHQGMVPAQTSRRRINICGNPDNRDLQLQQQLQQPYLIRGRTLAMEILGELMELPQVAAQFQEGRTGAMVAEQQVQALVAAAEAAEAATSSHALALGAALSLVAEEQQRQRNAAARLLRRLAGNVPCAQEFLSRPGVVSELLDRLSHLWDTYAPALVPAAAAARLPRTGLSAGFPGGSRGPGPITAAAAVEANGGISAATSDCNLNLSLANRRNSALHTDSRQRLLISSGGGGGAAQPPPSVSNVALGSSASGVGVGGTLPSSPSGRLATFVPSISPTVPDGPSGAGANNLSVTAAPGTISGLGPQSSGLAPTHQQLPRPQTPLLGATRSGGGGGGVSHPAGLLPHGVTTRMSLNAAVCTEAARWTSPAQHAMKALELSAERQQPPSNAAAYPYFRHANTHNGSTIRPSPLSAGSRPCRTDSGRGGGEDEGSDNGMSDEDSFAMLRDVAPPPGSLTEPPPLPQPPLGHGQQQQLPPPPPPLCDTGISRHRSGRIAEVAFVPNLDGSVAVGPGVGRVPEPDDGESGSGTMDDPEGGGVMRSTVLRRGTRALAPPVAPGAGLPPGVAPAPRTSAAASAAHCATELLQLLLLLAEGDVDAARAMATLPAVELFVDMLAASSGSLVLAAMQLMERLAERQDAHETFWDCDAVAQLVVHLQLRSAAAAVAAAEAATVATAVADHVPRYANGEAIPFPGRGAPSALGTTAAAEAEAAASTASDLQLGAARVLERLCGDPDLHGRLAATELPAALMAVVKRSADQRSTSQSQVLGIFVDKSTPYSASTAQVQSASRPPGSNSGALLVCVLTALASLLECEDVRRQARERRLPLQLGILAGSSGEAIDLRVPRLAAQCG
ncbi:hypothetical protein Vretimale_19105, partial [Volvox reticuliferus]